jgi:NitT/TauT family transport system substrate-binding protein
MIDLIKSGFSARKIASPMPRIRLCENMRALGYAPFYFALATGAFAAEELEVDMITSPSASRTGEMLLSGAADVSWGGPMRVMMHHQADPACPLVCFAQIVARDPFVLVGREPNARDFHFSHLLGRRLSVATEVPTPFLMLQDDIARAGIDPGALIRTDASSMEQAVERLIAGRLDVAQVFEPYVDRLLEAGCHIWHRSTDRGDIGYTTFYATRGFIDANRDVCHRLVRGMTAAARAFHAAAPLTIAAAIRGYFPDLDLAVLGRVIGRYRTARLWAETPDLPPATFVRLKAALLSGGLITHDFPYDHIVDAGLSRAD